MSGRIATFDDTNWDADVLGGRVLVGKLDIDESPQTAERYGIRGVPTLVLFQHGEAMGRVVGVTSQEDLAKWITEHVGSGDRST